VTAAEAVALHVCSHGAGSPEPKSSTTSTPGTACLAPLKQSEGRGAAAPQGAAMPFFCGVGGPGRGTGRRLPRGRGTTRLRVLRGTRRGGASRPGQAAGPVARASATVELKGGRTAEEGARRGKGVSRCPLYGRLTLFRQPRQWPAGFVDVQDDYEVWFGVKSFEEVGVLPGATELRGDRRPPSPSTCARVAHVSSPAPAAAKHLEAITSEADLRALVVVSVDPTSVSCPDGTSGPRLRPYNGDWDSRCCCGSVVGRGRRSSGEPFPATPVRMELR
jgi:hypothetical protein